MTPSLYSFNYVCAKCGISPRTLRRYIKEGLISPCYTEEGVITFDEETLERLEIIKRLRYELGVNIAGIDIILRLTARIRELQSMVEGLEGGVGAQKGVHQDRGDEGTPCLRLLGREIITVDIQD